MEKVPGLQEENQIEHNIEESPASLSTLENEKKVSRSSRAVIRFMELSLYILFKCTIFYYLFKNHILKFYRNL